MLQRGWFKTGMVLVILVLVFGGIKGYEWWQTRPFNASTETGQKTPAVEHTRQPEFGVSHMPNTGEFNSTDQLMRDKSLNEPLAVLVVGVDERQHDSGRTDTIMVFTVNPDDRSMKILSIPRDTKTQLADVPVHTYDKINHAYSRGDGMASTKKTVEQFLEGQIPIDYTVNINMRGFEQIVDTFGGIKVNVPRHFSSHGYHYKKGPMHLDGEAALYYVRERSNSNDFDRNERQQQVLRALLDKTSRFSTLTKMNDIFRIWGQNVKTDLTPLQLVRLQRMYGHIRDEDIERLELTGQDEWSDAYYFIADDTSKTEVIDTLRTHLQLE